jgi:Bacterial Ig-like domain (group 3)
MTFDGYHSGPMDQVGDVDADLNIVGGRSMDVLNPGLSVAGTFTGHSSPLLFEDSPGSVLAVRRDAGSYAADHGQGALIVHFHNLVGAKAQVVSLKKQTASVKLTMSPNPVVHGKTVTATVTVTGSSGTPTGTVTLRRTDGSKPTNIVSGPLVNGKATLKYTPKSKGTFHYQAVYSGDANYNARTSSTVTLKIT